MKLAKKIMNLAFFFTEASKKMKLAFFLNGASIFLMKLAKSFEGSQQKKQKKKTKSVKLAILGGNETSNFLNEASKKNLKEATKKKKSVKLAIFGGMKLAFF